MRAHVAIVEATRKPWMNGSFCYYYYDLTTGPGVVNGIEGSPLIAKRLLKDTPHLMALFEKDRDSARSLMKRFSGDPSVWVLNEDFANIRVHIEPRIRHNSPIGLMYWDGNGTIPPKEDIADIFSGEKFKRIDLLMHVASTNMKRCRVVGENAREKGSNGKKSCRAQPNVSTLDLCANHKMKWLVSTPEWNQGWTFILGTNYEGYKSYRKIGLHDINTFDGTSNLMISSFTGGERDIQERFVIRRSGKHCEDRGVCGGELLPAEDGAMGYCWKTKEYYWSCRRCQLGKARRYRAT